MTCSSGDRGHSCAGASPAKTTPDTEPTLSSGHSLQGAVGYRNSTASLLWLLITIPCSSGSFEHCRNLLGVKMPPFLWKVRLGLPPSTPQWLLQPHWTRRSTKGSSGCVTAIGRLRGALPTRVSHSHRVTPLCARPGLARALQSSCRLQPLQHEG